VSSCFLYLIKNDGSSSDAIIGWTDRTLQVQLSVCRNIGVW